LRELLSVTDAAKFIGLRYESFRKYKQLKKYGVSEIPFQKIGSWTKYNKLDLIKYKQTNDGLFASRSGLISSAAAAELLEITPEAFRKKSLNVDNDISKLTLEIRGTADQPRFFYSRSEILQLAMKNKKLSVNSNYDEYITAERSQELLAECDMPALTSSYHSNGVKYKLIDGKIKYNYANILKYITREKIHLQSKRQTLKNKKYKFNYIDDAKISCVDESIENDFLLRKTIIKNRIKNEQITKTFSI